MKNLMNPYYGLLYCASNGVVPSCDGRRTASGFFASNGLLPASDDEMTSATGSFGVQPGPGYAKIDTLLVSSIGVWLDADMNKRAVVLLIFSTLNKQSLRVATVAGGATSSGKMRPRDESSE